MKGAEPLTWQIGEKEGNAEEAIKQTLQNTPNHQMDAVELLTILRKQGIQDMDAREALWNMVYFHKVTINNNWAVKLVHVSSK